MLRFFNCLNDSQAAGDFTSERVICVGCIEALWGRGDSLQAKAHRGVERLEAPRNVRILRVTQKLWGIQLVLRL